MAKYQSQSLTLNLAALKSAGGSPSGDFVFPTLLPVDCIVLGVGLQVTTALAGPGLVSAKANLQLAPESPLVGQLSADLMAAGNYDNGGQLYMVNVSLKGCTLDALDQGAFTATVYYDQFKL